MTIQKITLAIRELNIIFKSDIHLISWGITCKIMKTIRTLMLQNIISCINYVQFFLHKSMNKLLQESNRCKNIILKEFNKTIFLNHDKE